MRRRRSLPKGAEQFFYIFECVTIVLYFIFSLTQEILVARGYQIYQSSDSKYFKFLLNVRLVMTRYPSNITLVDASQSCPENFSPVNLLSVSSFSKASFVDITDNTTIINLNTKKAFNNSEMGFKFYRFDINEPANDYVELSNLYTFNTWKSYPICAKYLNLDYQYQALQFIPLNKDCSTMFPNDYSVDCGKFSNFRICSLKSKLMDDNQNLLTSLYSDINQFNDVCPVNGVNLNFVENPKYNPNSNDPSNNKYLYSLDLKTTKDEVANDKILYLDFDLAYFDGCQNNLSLTDDYFYKVNDQNAFYVMPPDKNWGVADIFTRTIDSSDFTSYWNDYTQKFNLAPGFLNDSTMSNFYQLVDINPQFNNSRVKVNLAMYDNYVPTSDCISTLLFNKGRYDYINLINSVLMPYYGEHISTFLIWNIASIFMSIYCSIFIRFRFLILLLNGEANSSDRKDENIMKFSFKFLQFWVFLIKIVAITNIIKDIGLIKSTALDIVNAKCYDLKILNDGLLYSVEKLDETLKFYLISFYLLLSIFLLEILNLIFYIKLWYGKYSEQMAKLKEEEELRKEQELIQLAFGQNHMSKKIN